MAQEELRPNLEEFLMLVREAFSCLNQYGFAEVASPPHRLDEQFQVWFSAGDRHVVVRASGWGTTVDVTLETGALRLYERRLTTTVTSSRRRGEHRETSQREEIRESAQRLCESGSDFLGGDMQRFNQLAQSLPPYLMPPE